MLHSNNLFDYDSNTIKDTIQGLYSLSVSDSLEEMYQMNF